MTRWLPVGSLGLLFLFAGSSAFMIQHELYSGQSRPAAGDVLYRLIGNAQEAVGDTLYYKADSYLHGGVEEDFHESPEDLRREGDIEEEHGEPAPQDWIQKINSQIKVHEHRHLKADKQKEILPFLAWATALDPHNVEAILTEAYWLGQRFNKKDAALQVLLKGRRENPDQWQIDFALAEIEFKERHDFALTEYYCRQALSKSATRRAEAYYSIDLYYYLGESCLAQGKKAEALEAYQKSHTFFKVPVNALEKMIVDRIEELK